jgi:hypothetical protein
MQERESPRSKVATSAPSEPPHRYAGASRDVGDIECPMESAIAVCKVCCVDSESPKVTP